MLLLDDARYQFAEFLSKDPAAKFRMDAAFAYVIEQAYNKGYRDGVESVTSNPE